MIHKFRAWDIKEKKMIYDPFVYDTNETLGEFSMVRLNKALKDKRFVYLEYTGLKDTNNIEIYEGDIIEVFSSNSSNTLLEGIYSVVYWCDGFKLEWDSFGETQHRELGAIPNGNNKVIGNVFEDPKLLKNL